MTDYSSEIAALTEAIASGATRVSYDGKSVDYDSLDGLKRRLAWLKGEATGRRRPSAGFASFDRGDR